MSETKRQGHLGRSILAILVGMVGGIAVTLATDQLLHKMGVFPPWGASMTGYDFPLLLATIYRTIYGVAGSYVAARIAQTRPMLHAMILGALGFLVSAVGAAVTWNGGPAFGPHWYPVALVVLALPTAWLGGKLAEMHFARSPGALQDSQSRN